MEDSTLDLLWSITNGLVPFGGIFGAIMSGFVADYFGRYSNYYKVFKLLFNALIISAYIFRHTAYKELKP